MKIKIEDCLNDYIDEVKDLLHHRSKLRWWQKIILWLSILCLLLFSFTYLFMLSL